MDIRLTLLLTLELFLFNICPTILFFVLFSFWNYFCYFLYILSFVFNVLLFWQVFIFFFYFDIDWSFWWCFYLLVACEHLSVFVIFTAYESTRCFFLPVCPVLSTAAVLLLPFYIDIRSNLGLLFVFSMLNCFVLSFLLKVLHSSGVSSWLREFLPELWACWYKLLFSFWIWRFEAFEIYLEC